MDPYGRSNRFPVAGGGRGRFLPSLCWAGSKRTPAEEADRVTHDRTTELFAPNEKPDAATIAAAAGSFSVGAHFVRVEGGDEEKCLAGGVDDDFSAPLEPGEPKGRNSR